MLHKIARMIGRMFDSTRGAKSAEAYLTAARLADEMMLRNGKTLTPFR
jgi:hypothetical protein